MYHAALPENLGQPTRSPPMRSPSPLRLRRIPPAARGGQEVGGWVARFEESQIKTRRTGEVLDVAVEERDGWEAPPSKLGGTDHNDRGTPPNPR